MPMIHTTNEDLERFGKLWDAWQDPKKPTRLWFAWWCVGQQHIPDDQKVAEFKRQLTVH